MYVCMYVGFKTLFYTVRYLGSTASYLPTGLHLGFFRSWPSLYLLSSFLSLFLKCNIQCKNYAWQTIHEKSWWPSIIKINIKKPMRINKIHKLCMCVCVCYLYGCKMYFTGTVFHFCCTKWKKWIYIKGPVHLLPRFTWKTVKFQYLNLANWYWVVVVVVVYIISFQA